MKIAVDGSIFVSRLTGIGNYGYYLLRAMAAQSPEDEFIILTQQPMCVEFSEPNITVYMDNTAVSRNIYIWKSFSMYTACTRAGVDLFWAASGVAPFFMPCPVVLTVYDFVNRADAQSMSWRTRWFRYLNQPWWIHRAIKVFAISQAVDNEMQNYYRRRADAVVRPAANAMFSRPETLELIDARSRYHLHGRYNLIVGTLEPRKNLHLFISQYLLFHKYHPEIELPLLALIGGKGWNDAQIVETIEEGEQCGLVRRLGYVPTDDLPALYSEAELFFMPSRYEGFGMPILEARMCGCPTVCSDVPAMREAGGQQALYHAPSAEGIYAVLVSLYTMNHFPVSDFGAGVDWTWESGAATTLGLFHDATDR